MVLFNYSTKEITAKIVYYGPGLCGKTTNLQFIYDNLPGTINKGKMLSLATKTDRTLFFDFLPIDLGTIRGMRTRLQLYTVPGQVFYNTTRKLVLKGADGVVFVADSQKRMIDANIESFKNLEENLAEHDMKLAEMPMIVQFNKRDLPEVAGIEELNTAINKFNAPIYEAVATTGIGVHETLKAITRLVLNSLKEKYADKREQRPEPPQQVVEAAAAAGKGAGGARGGRVADQPTTWHASPVATVSIQPPSNPSLPPLPVLEAQEDFASPDFELDPIEPGPTAHPPGAVLEVTEESVLELADDTDLTMDTEDSALLELVSGDGTHEADAPLELEPFEDSSMSAPSPLDVTEEVFRAEEPLLSDDTSPDEMPSPIPVAAETDTDPAFEAAWVETDLPAEIAEVPLALIAEESHDIGFDLSDLEPPLDDATGALAVPGRFEDDRLNIPFHDGPSVPIASQPETVVAGVHEIRLPISLEIGGKSIRFHLKVSLDLGSLKGIEMEDGTDGGVRS